MSFLNILLLFGTLIILSCGHPLEFPHLNILTKAPYDVQPNEYRLKTNVKPSQYKIQIEPFFEVGDEENKPFTFRGNVQITVLTKDTAVKEIELHAYQLDLLTIVITDDQGKLVQRGDETYQNETQKLKIPLLENLKANNSYVIDITYTGVLNDEMGGFYRSQYDEEGKKKWLGTTQFQVTDARKAFPCFDEPAFKAKFQLTVIRPKDYHRTLTNTLIESEQEIEEGTKVRETFKQTPAMSTYLMAFVVQMFNGNQTQDKHFGVWARPEAQNQLTYAFGVGEKLLSEMGTWVDYPFNNVTEIQKVDMIAIPDYLQGAMENWGALIFAERALLYDEKESSLEDKELIASIISHEVAHLWFGDLITCDWWSATWLNEGFANYFEYFVTQLVEKDWNLAWKFIPDVEQAALESDSLPSTHPLTNPEVYTPEQALLMFKSRISYRKGGSILRMIEHYMGTDNFKKALQVYLKTNEYKAVKPEKLFTSLDAHSPDPKVSEIFTPWTTQPGYPVLTVTSQENDTIKVNQKRFLLNDKNHNDKTRWSVPITYANRPEHFNQTTTGVIYPSSQTTDFSIKLPANPTLDFYILNVQEIGYYRVNYNKENWEAISAALRAPEQGKIHVVNRAQIVDDLLNLARSGILSYEFALGILDYVRSEPNYIPWVSMFNGLTHLSKRIGNGGDYDRFRKHIIHLTENIYDRLGFEPKPNEAQIDTLLRTHVLNWICKHRHEDCINKAKEEFEKLKTDGNHIVNPNVRVPIYCSAIRDGTEDDFNFLWNKFMESNVAAEKTKILNALGCAKTQALIDSLLDKILSDDVRKQDKERTFTNSYIHNHENVDFVYNYLTNNYKKWEAVMGNVGSALSALSDYFTTEEQVNNLEEFGKTNGLGETNVKVITDAVESARKNLEWDKERLVEVRNYYKLVDGNSATSVSINICLTLLSTAMFFYLS